MTLLISLILFLAQSPGDELGKEAWEWINPIPQGNRLMGVAIPDSTNPATAVAVGRAGTIMRTDDGGKAWTVEHHVQGYSGGFTDLEFIDHNTGIVVGGEGEGIILKTDNGGIDWKQVFRDSSVSFQAVCYSNPITLMAVGTNTLFGGSVYISSDSGENWIETLQHQYQFYGVASLSDSLFVVVGSGVALRTTDLGATWDGIVADTVGLLQAVCARSDTDAVAVGSRDGNNRVLHTSDAGVTWQPLKTPGDILPRAVSCVSEDIIVIVGQDTTILRSTDGGMSWITQTITAQSILLDVDFSSSDNGIVVGDFGVILTTTNGGNDWLSKSEGIRGTLYGIQLNEDGKGLTVGNQGLILQTTDWGRTWTQAQNPVGEPMNTLVDVCFPNPQTAVAVGYNGALLHSSDGGLSWNALTSGITDQLSTVVFTSQDTGRAIGWNGASIYTTNGGASWLSQPISGQPYISGSSFYNSRSGIAVGLFGIVLRTIDGGESWSMQSINNGWLHDVSHANQETLVAAGSDGGIFRSTDSGLSWVPQTSGTINALSDVFFLSNSSGFVVGEDGSILFTSDGGVTWTSQSGGTTSYLFGISAVDSVVIAVGEGGTILRKVDPNLTGHEDIAGELPTYFLLEQNYPNPFNPTTTIRYAIPKDSHVSLKIYDILGREILTLIEAERNVGYHQVVLEAGSLASGLYFCQLRSGSFLDTKKLLLLR